MCGWGAGARMKKSLKVDEMLHDTSLKNIRYVWYVIQSRIEQNRVGGWICGMLWLYIWVQKGFAPLSPAFAAIFLKSRAVCWTGRLLHLAVLWTDPGSVCDLLTRISSSFALAASLLDYNTITKQRETSYRDRQANSALIVGNSVWISLRIVHSHPTKL